MRLSALFPRLLLLILAAGSSFLLLLGAGPDTTRSRIALFEPAGEKNDTTLGAALSAVADSVELSLDVLQRYEVKRLPAMDPATDLNQVRAYCQKNRIDQAIMGSGSAREGGGYSFRLVVYDRKTDKVTTDQKGSSKGALDMFDVTDALVAALLDGLSGTHLLFGSLTVESTPAGATISVNGRNVGKAPLSLRGLPVGTLELSARLDGYEGADATVTISDGDTTSSSLTLPRSMGVLSVSMPKDAVMTVSSAGAVQKKVQGPGIAILPAGDYDVEADCPGLPAVEAKVTIASGVSTPWVPWVKGYLDVRSDPEGATIVLDGQERGAAPRVVEVEPGKLHHLELRKENYQAYRSDVSPDAGSKMLFSGSLAPIVVSQPPAAQPAPSAPSTSAVYKIEGSFSDWKNVPSWRGIQPILDLSGASPRFMGDPKYAMAQVYMCRDDKYLYWRVDFAGTNPIRRSPAGMKLGIDCELTVHFQPTMQMHLGAQTLLQGPGLAKAQSTPKVIQAYGAIHDDSANKWSLLKEIEEVSTSDKTLIARISLDEMFQYCKAPVPVEFKLGNEIGDGTWDSTQVSETRTIDFSK
jgi:hypothetical protein